MKVKNWLLLRRAFHGGNLANVEVLLLVFCYSNGPNTCPFGRAVDGRGL